MADSTITRDKTAGENAAEIKLNVDKAAYDASKKARDDAQKALDAANNMVAKTAKEKAAKKDAQTKAQNKLKKAPSLKTITELEGKYKASANLLLTEQGKSSSSTRSFSNISRGTIKTVKLPTNNVFAVTEQAITADSLEEIFFDSIGATDIVNIEPHDQLGSSKSKTVISGKTEVNTEYSPNNLIKMLGTSSELFRGFPIQINKYLVEDGMGTGPGNATHYLDSTTGNIIINFKDIPDGYNVEVETIAIKDSFYDTMYI